MSDGQRCACNTQPLLDQLALVRLDLHRSHEKHGGTVAELHRQRQRLAQQQVQHQALVGDIAQLAREKQQLVEYLALERKWSNAMEAVLRQISVGCFPDRLKAKATLAEYDNIFRGLRRKLPELDYSSDARDYGDAINEASWAAMEEYRNRLGPLPGGLFNNMKSILRMGVLTYIQIIERKQPEPTKPLLETNRHYRGGYDGSPVR